MPGAAQDIELTLFERIGERTYPCRVRDPHEWAAALAAAETTAPEALTGLLEWACPRCGGTCEAYLATLCPITFDRPAVHWCEPSGLKRLGALWNGAGIDGHQVVPELPALPVPA